MYELIILSLLMREPIHGYLISKIINDIIGPLAKVSHGWLYPRLAKLEQEGLIVTLYEGEEEKKVSANFAPIRSRKKDGSVFMS